MTRLVFELLRPYRGRLAIVFVAMLIEIGASLAAPWPLKLVLDDALGNHHLPHWLDWAHEYGGFGSTNTCTGFRSVTTITPKSERWSPPSQATSLPSRISRRRPRSISWSISLPSSSWWD
jgi:hypothetical protein